MERRNYISMIDSLNDGFGANGWADGYADLPSDHEKIINQLYGKIPNLKLIEFLDLYLQGYELGCFMSDEIENIYDENGDFKDDIYDLTTASHYNQAKKLVLIRVSNNQEKRKETI